MVFTKAEAAFQKAASREFPRLARGNFAITSPKDHHYNCIAWAAGDTSRWWWPLGKYWPAGGPQSTSLDAFVMMYAALGFEECASFAIEEGFEKIALYSNQSGQVTHAARQLSDGTWTSKLGRDHDIQHTVEALEGGAYGKVAKFLRRAVTDPSI